MSYDPSTDYARYPTLAPLPVGKLSGRGDYVSCPGCGGTNFLLRRADRKLLCARCGSELELQAAPVPASKAVIPATRKPVPPRLQAAGLANDEYVFLCPDGSVKAFTYHFGRHNDQYHGKFEVCDSGKNGACKVQNWTDITAISAKGCATAGLRSDGTVLAAGLNAHGKCHVQDWSGITAIASNWDCIMGLCKDGTVKVAGSNHHEEHKIRDWTGITAIALGEYHTIGLCANGTVKAVGWNYDGQCNVQNWTNITAIAASNNTSVGLCSDGTVKAVGQNNEGQCNVQEWRDIIAIASMSDCTIGLHRDGTLRLAGSHSRTWFLRDALQWQDLVSIQVIRDYDIIAMQSNGTYLCTHPDFQKQLNELARSIPPVERNTNPAAMSKMPILAAHTSSPFFCCAGGKVEAYGYSSRDGSVNHCTDRKFTGTLSVQHDMCMVGGWSDITALAVGGAHTVGLRSDGTVVAVGYNGNGQCNLQDWTNITAIGAGYHHTVGLRSDGTVLAISQNNLGECGVRGWTGITAIAVGFSRTLGLRADGTVLAVGANPYGAYDVRGWTGMTALALSLYHTAGLRRDGTVVVTGRNENGELDNVRNWTGITAIAATLGRIFGLHKDGTLRMSGYIGFLEKEILAWRDIVSIQAIGEHIVAMQSDGTFLCNSPEIAKLLNSRFR